MIAKLEDINRCEVCLDEDCKGNHNCHCTTCKHLSECYKVLHATIRITNKCTQKCTHCCFSSHPNSNIMMSTDNAKNIAIFLENNNVVSINLMGGEFFCNTEWFEIINIFINSVNYIRIVSNGDWYNNIDVKEKILKLNEKYKSRFRISISNDSYHTNKYTTDVEKWLKDNNVDYNIGTEDDMKEEAIIPIGRGEMYYSIYSSFSCYCHNPSKKYSFLIDEIGNIYKCGFGVWQYANIYQYLNGGFASRFKEFNKKFYDIFLPSCTACIRAAAHKDNNIVSND